MVKLLAIYLFIQFSFAQENPECSPTEQINDEAVEQFSDIQKNLCIFQNTAIFGASVSKGTGAKDGGAGAIIAKTLNPASEYKNYAKEGEMAQTTYANHQVPNPAPSIFIGVDLFFWDAARKKCDDDTLTKMEHFLQLYQDQKIPMILGVLPTQTSIPDGYKVLQGNDCAKKFNKLVEKKCTIENNCLTFDIQKELQAIEVIIKTRAANLPGNYQDNLKSEFKKMFPDNLHPSHEVNTIFAQNFIKSRQYQQLKCIP